MSLLVDGCESVFVVGCVCLCGWMGGGGGVSLWLDACVFVDGCVYAFVDGCGTGFVDGCVSVFVDGCGCVFVDGCGCASVDRCG